MQFKVFQLDTWIEPDGTWRVNDSMEICKLSVNGDPTVRKILSAMYEKNLLLERRKFTVDDYFSYDGMWCIVQRSNLKPVFDLMEIE